MAHTFELRELDMELAGRHAWPDVITRASVSVAFGVKCGSGADHVGICANGVVPLGWEIERGKVGLRMLKNSVRLGFARAAQDRLNATPGLAQFTAGVISQLRSLAFPGG